jgi:hypothetical protein
MPCAGVWQEQTCDQIFLTNISNWYHRGHCAQASAWFYLLCICSRITPLTEPIPVRFESTLYEHLKAAKPTFLSTTDFIQCMAAQGLSGLDSGITLIKPSAPQAGPRPYGAECFISNKEVIEEKEIKTRKKAPKDRFSSKLLNYADIPDELQDCADQIVEFWSVKKGTRSERAAKLLFDKLLAMSPSDRIKALDAAYNAQWASVFPPKPDAPTQGRHNHQAAPEFVHPAHRVFSNGQFDDEKDWPESQTGGKGVLDI